MRAPTPCTPLLRLNVTRLLFFYSRCCLFRTRAEQRAAGPGTPLGSLLNDTAAWCSELSGALDHALEEEDVAEVARIR